MGAPQPVESAVYRTVVAEGLEIFDSQGLLTHYSHGGRVTLCPRRGRRCVFVCFFLCSPSLLFLVLFLGEFSGGQCGCVGHVNAEED